MNYFEIMPDTIYKGDKIKILYVAKKEDGSIVDYTPKDKPIEFTVGNKEILSGVDIAVEGMYVGEKKSFEIMPENAFGIRNNELTQQIPREALPKEIEIKEGKVISVKTPKGFQFQAIISQYDDKTVTLDLNHPLAGHKITFEIHVIQKLQPQL